MHLSKARWYIKLNVRNTYNQLCITSDDKYKTVLWTREGLFESLVMSFGLMKALSFFQSYINDTQAAFRDRYVTTYLNDVLIYSDNFGEHRIRVRSFWKALSGAVLHVKQEKFEFQKKEGKHLELIIGRGGNNMDSDKVVAVEIWPVPQSTFNFWSFFGFTNFYRWLISNLSQIVHQLTVVTRKGVKFKWSEEDQQAFETLRKAFVTTPVVAHFDWTKKMVVEINVWNCVSVGVLSQQGDNGVLHPVTFYSKKHFTAESNYKIYDKELMVIVSAFEKWQAELESVESYIHVLSDPKKQEYFISNKNLSRLQV